MRRVVFYISGFDPRGARHYYRFFRDEAAKSALPLTVGKAKKRGDKAMEWVIECEGRRVPYVFLCWDDLIRSRWITSPLTLFSASVRSYARYIFSGAGAKSLRHSRNAATALFYPLLIGGAWTLGGAVAASLPYLSGLHPVGAGALSVSIAALVGYFGVKSAKKHKLGWLLRIYAFCSNYAKRDDAAVAARVGVFARAVRKAMAEADEVILIGHSVGSILAYETVAELLRDGVDCDKLTLLTLGQCVPLVGCLPEAEAFRTRMAAVAASRIKRTDVSSPADGACVPLSDPLERLDGIKTIAAPAQIFSPRFHKSFSPESYAALKKDRFDMHFAYLMAPDKGGEFDFFRTVTQGGASNRS